VTDSNEKTADGILIIDGHPNPDSFCAALAQKYADAARQAGAKVEILSLRDLSFDVILHQGYQAKQALEPDLVKAQAMIKASRHLVIVTPVWWGSMPALLKGFLDRTMERGWAFRYGSNGLPEGLLAGRSARLIVSTDSPLWYLRWIQGDPTVRSLVRSTLKFCGFKPVALTRIGPVHGSDDKKREQWLEKVFQAGQVDARR
jgi:NAD(P)H dehydrogenase (quinone)